MSSYDASLYGIPRPTKKSSGKEISSSGSLAFTSQLSSLISTGNVQSSRSSSGRSRSKKEDIFSTHNKGSKKRALKDLEPDASSFEQKHTTNGEALDAAIWHRNKRKMEDKARLYAAMKRGDLEDEEGKHMVDFDKKWAESGTANKDGEESEDDDSETEEEQVAWVDEFGRARTGTRTQMVRDQRTRQLQDQIEERARPAAPTNIIYGDTVQADAFNPDSDATDRMATLAAKRDRSLTPPPDMHFDSSKEVRHKGVGYMQFSQDADERRKQMQNLEADRAETERRRADREMRTTDRKEQVEKRRREIQERRGKKKADEFLENLGAELESKESRQET